MSFDDLLRMLRFLWDFGPRLGKHMLLPLALLAGLSRDWVMITVNKAAAAPLDVALGYWLPIFAMLLVVILGTSFAYHMLSTSVTAHISNEIRLRMIGNLMKAQPSFIDKHQHGAIYHILTTDVGIITSFITTLLNLLPAVVFLSIAVPQLFYYSTTAGIFALFVMIAGTFTYYYQQKLLLRLNENARQLDVDYFEQVSEALHGIRELRLHIPRRNSFTQKLRGVLSRLKAVTLQVKKIYEFGELATNGMKYILFAGIVFLVPFLKPTEATTILQLLAFVLFSLIPFESIVSSYPSFISAIISFYRIRDLNAQLSQYERVNEFVPAKVDAFETIYAKDIVARHHSRETSKFVLGPLDFELKRGDVVFFVGHNGSGKTTFMNVLAGLLDIDSGEIRLDGAKLQPDDMAAYRSRISTVFTHYHVFRELHGLENVSPSLADEALERVGLTGLTNFKDGRVARLDLSAGQKRRLALAIVLLEDRELLILDEFVADQDPKQREYFFRTLLPWLKQQGKTVIVSTHDLQWMDCADRVYLFSEGKMTEQMKKGESTISLLPMRWNTPAATEKQSQQADKKPSDSIVA